MSELEYWHPGLSCCNPRWEQAYAAFETPEEERRKFRKRFEELGIDQLDKNLSVVDIFCGRGNGLVELQKLGFRNLTGVDLSPELLSGAPVGVRRIVADCTDLKFEAGSVDVFIVQGGLHHLPKLPEHLEQCLGQVAAALTPGGVFYVIEPWRTPFLDCIHFVTRQKTVRRLVPKFDAFATMVEEEIETYNQWLGQPKAILECFETHFKIERKRIGFGKIALTCRKEGVGK